MSGEAPYTADAFLIVELRENHYGQKSLAIVGARQGEPTLKPFQRAVRLQVQVDREVFEPRPTPSTTISVKAPIDPDPEVVVLELPQSPFPREGDQRGAAE